MSLVDVLTTLGYEVQAVADGEEALAVLTAPGASVNLILSDLVMPGISGIVLLEQLRQQGIYVPFILITGHAFTADMATLRNSGMYALLSKPPSVELLAKTLAEALR